MPAAISKAADDDRFAPIGILEQIYPFQPNKSGLDYAKRVPIAWMYLPQPDVLMGLSSSEKCAGPNSSEIRFI